MVPTRIQDSIKPSDTVAPIKASKLIPATKIESSDGAIIPKEAMEWSELEPSFPTKEKTPASNENYVWFALGIILLIGILIFLFRKRTKKQA